MASQTANVLKRAEIVKKFGASAQDTGKAEVQVALLTDRIEHLTSHSKTAPKDFSARRGLLMLVGQRKRLLTYLKSADAKRYIQVVQALGLRK